MRNEAGIKNLAQRLRQQYGKDIHAIIVFGSVARHSDDGGSDIDVMIVFDSQKHTVDWRLQREVRSLALPVELEEDVVFDLKVAGNQDLQGLRGHTPFIERVLSEGVRV